MVFPVNFSNDFCAILLLNAFPLLCRESVGHFLERVAGEFNQLQFHVNQSKGHPIIDNIKSVSKIVVPVSKPRI